jgi:hypothetical protein
MPDFRVKRVESIEETPHVQPSTLVRDDGMNRDFEERASTMKPEGFAELLVSELRRLGAEITREETLMLIRSVCRSSAFQLGPRQTAEIWVKTGLVSTMAEIEWLTCVDPDPMLRRLRFKGFVRDLTLFGCACCRRIWDLMPDEVCRQAVVVTERFLDGLAGKAELDAKLDGADQVFAKLAREHDEICGRIGTAEYASDLAVARHASEAVMSLYEQGYYAAVNASLGAAYARTRAGAGPKYREERAAQAALLRAVIVDPFQPASPK